MSISHLSHFKRKILGCAKMLNALFVNKETQKSFFKQILEILILELDHQNVHKVYISQKVL